MKSMDVDTGTDTDRKPIKIALTGSIGMGKSTVARVFKSLNYPVFDADEAVHTLYSPGSKAMPEIAALFPVSNPDPGPENTNLAMSATPASACTPAESGPLPLPLPLPHAVASAGGVDRRALSVHLMLMPEKLSQLEAIVHPLVVEMRAKWYDDACAENCQLVLYDIPLLYEKPTLSERYDYVLCVNCDEDKQQTRVLARPGMTVEKFAYIKSRQWPCKQKCEQAGTCMCMCICISVSVSVSVCACACACGSVHVCMQCTYVYLCEHISVLVACVY